MTNGRRVNGIAKIIDKPKEVDSYLEAVGALVGDGMTGYACGKFAERTIRRTEINAAENLKATRQSKGFDANKSIAPERTREIYCEATDIKPVKLTAVLMKVSVADTVTQHHVQTSF